MTGMSSVVVTPLSSAAPLPLVEQITGYIRGRIDERRLRAGSRMPSIRKFAEDNGVSRFTVVEAYDRLVAQGYLESRRGSGFYVRERPQPMHTTPADAGVLVTEVLDLAWNGLNQAILDASATCHMPDVLEMPYRPEIFGAAEPGVLEHTYRLGGLTCLAGDVMGDYSFAEPLQVGQRIVFGDGGSSESAAAGLRRVHERVEGSDARGKPYRALEPELLMWVHATLIDTSLLVYDRFVRPLGIDRPVAPILADELERAAALRKSPRRPGVLVRAADAGVRLLELGLN